MLRNPADRWHERKVVAPAKGLARTRRRGNGVLMRAPITTLFSAFALVALSACSSSGGDDELQIDVDAATPRRDAGSSIVVDAGAELDAETVQDASIPVVTLDAGSGPSVDASVPSSDSGTLVDAGHAADATVVADAGGLVPDAGSDATVVVADAGRDAGVADAGVADAGTAVDSGTVGVGAVCTGASSDCHMAAGLTGICSGASPSPSCIATGCAITTPTAVEYCDSDRGVCLSGTTSNYCVQKCGFTNSTSAPTGCTGTNRCNAYGFSRDASSIVSGVGFCLGGCASTAECPTGTLCQVEEGLCVSPAAFVTYTLAVGSTCTAGTTTTCNCIGHTGASGVCTKACVVGRAATCASGFTCASDVPKTFSDGSAAFTAQPSGTAGNCYKNCVSNASCPTGTYCDTNDVAGMVCKPNP